MTSYLIATQELERRTQSMSFMRYLRPEGDHSDAGPLSHWCKLKLFMGVDHQAHANAGQWSVNTFQESYRGHVTISVIEKSTDTGSWLGRIVYVQYKLTQRTESGLPSTGSCSIFYSPADATVVTCNGCPHSSSRNRVGDPTCPLISSLF